MREWIVIGESAKMDGLLYIVMAEDSNVAMKKVASLSDTRFLDFDGEFALLPKDSKLTDNEVQEMLVNGEARWFWSVYVEELEMDQNMAEIVCW